MAYSRTPIEINVNNTFNEWRVEVNAAIERLNQLFNASDELEPFAGGIFDAAVLTGPIVTAGSFDNPTVTTGTLNGSTINNPTVSSPTVTGGTFTGVTVDDTSTLQGLSTGAYTNIGAGPSELIVRSDLDAASDEGAPVAAGAFLGQDYYDTTGLNWYKWNGTTWDQMVKV